MRVGLLTTSFPRQEGDVAGSFVLGYARALAASGHRVEVLAPEPATRVAPPSWPGVHTSFVPYLRPQKLQRTFYGAGAPDNLARDPVAVLGALPYGAALAASMLARRRAWDAVVSHWALPCGLLGAALRGRRRHVCVLHSADLHMLCRMPLGDFLARRLVRGTDVLSFVSEHGRERFMSLLPSGEVARARDRSCVQPMGYEDVDGPVRAQEESRHALRARLGVERFTLFSLARLVPIKGLREAIAALGHRGDLDWWIAGDGPERDALSALAHTTRLRVRLLGTVTGPDKHALLRAADVFVLPSRELASGRTEGTPTAMLEAMAAELPVVASQVGGMTEWILPGVTGHTFDPRLPHSLEHAIDAVRQNPVSAQAMANRARELVVSHSWARQAEHLSRIVTGFPGAAQRGTVATQRRAATRP